MNRIRRLGMTLCVAGVAACGARDAAGPEGPGVSAARRFDVAPGEQLPVTGHLDGSDEYPGLCGDGQGFLIVSTGTGPIAHFGNAVMVSTICANMMDFSFIGPATFSITAADGDEVTGLTTGITYTSYGFDFYTSITGGTGRFEHATGDLTWPTVATGSSTWSSSVEGWISY